MAGDIKSKYATSAALVITLAALADGAGRESTRVDNSTTLELDALITLLVVAGVVTGDKKLLVYAYGSSDDGVTFTDGCTGLNAVFTPADPTNLKFVGELNTPAAGTYRGTFSIARVFGGVLPKYWGIVVVNKTGVALTSGSVDVQGMKLQYT